MEKIINTILGIQTAFAQVDKAAAAVTEAPSQVQIMINNFVQAIPLWLTAAVVIILSFVLARVVKGAVENRMLAAGVEQEHKEIQIVAGRASSVIVMTIGITAGLKIAGLDLTPIIAAAAFGIGFALRDIIVNFLAGIIILLQKQYTVGDWIKVKAAKGIIQEIQSRYTVIKTFDGERVIVPNADLFKNQVTSYTSNPTRRLKINISIDFYYDLKEVIDLVYKSIDKCDKILKTPRPTVVVTQPGGYYNNLLLRCWVESRKGIIKPTSALMRQLHKDFYKKGWAWPFPTQTLIMDKDIKGNMEERKAKYIANNKKQKKEGTAVQVGIAAPISGQAPIQVQVSAPVTQEVPAWLKRAEGLLNENGSPVQSMPPVTIALGPEVKPYQPPVTAASVLSQMPVPGIQPAAPQQAVPQPPIYATAPQPQPQFQSTPTPYAAPAPQTAPLPQQNSFQAVQEPIMVTEDQSTVTLTQVIPPPAQAGQVQGAQQ